MSAWAVWDAGPVPVRPAASVGEQREAERSADLLRGVEHAGDHARVGVGGARHAEGGHGGQRQAAADAEQHEQRQQAGRVVGVRRDLGEQRERRR